MSKNKLTPWFDGSKFVPYHVGEYNASFFKIEETYRWWDGFNWSIPYNGSDSFAREYSKKKYQQCRKVLSGAALHKIQR